MRPKTHPKRRPPPAAAPSPPGLRAARVLFGVALCGAAYLAWVSLSSGPVPGCGAGSGCDRVLQSRWAYWLGIPVSVPAGLAYAALLAATCFAGPRRPEQQRRRAWGLLIVLSVTVVAAAVWFVGLQAVVLKAFCKFCLATHAGALAGGVLLLRNVPRAAESAGTRAWDDRSVAFGIPGAAFTRFVVLGVAGAAVLLTGQFLVEKKRHLVKGLSGDPATNLTVTLPSNLLASAVPPSTPSPAVAAPAPAPAVPTNLPPRLVERAGPRLLSLHGGQFLLNLDEVPLIGSPDAPHVIVSLFDYTCHHCRDLHPKLIEAQRRFGNELSIVSLPMPLATNCNPVVSRFFRPHALACEYARLGLAVWRAKREVFGQFDNWLFEPLVPVPVDQARQYAAQLVGPEHLDRALADDWITRLIHLSGFLYSTNYYRLGNSMMPELMIGSVATFGPLNSVQDLYAVLGQQLGLR